MKYNTYLKYKDTGNNWLPIIPEHWEFKRLKFASEVIFSNVDKKSEDGELLVKLCNYMDIFKNDYIDNSFEFMEASATNDEIMKFSLIEDDVAITKDSETPEEIAIPGYIKENLENTLCGYHLAVIRSNKEMLSGKYLFWLLKAKNFNTQFIVSANGVTRFGLGHYPIKNSFISIPPKIEQTLIANFLTYKTNGIDNLIAQKQKTLTLLTEKRISLITKAVTKGIHPSVEMNRSGIEWIGDMPKHWKKIKIKRLSLVKRGASPRPIDDPKYFDSEGEFSWVRIADVTSSKKYLENTTQKLSELGKSKSVPLEPGEIFLSIAATVGKPIITKIKCCIHDGFVYFPYLVINREFLYYIFLSGQPYLGLGKLGTQLNLNTDTIGDIYIALPDQKEQLSIVSYLNTELTKLDNIENSIKSAIEKLKEYRLSLITSAVTGKIDVRNFKSGSKE